MRKNTSKIKKILFVHNYLLGPKDGGSNRMYEMMEFLYSEGYETSALCTGYNPLTRKKINPELLNSKLNIKTYFSMPPQYNPILRFIALFLNIFLILPKLIYMARGVDLIYFTSPPIFTGLSIIITKWLTGIEYIFEIRDLWPESGVHLNILKRNSMIYHFMKILENRLINNAVFVVSLTRGISSYLKKNYPHIRIITIHNGVSKEKCMIKPKKYNNNLPLKIVFFGNLTGTSDPLIMGKIAEKLEKQVEIHIAGDGKMREELLRFVEEKNIKNLFYHGIFSNREIMNFISEMDISIVPILEGEFFNCVVSNKLLDSMAVSLPIILIGSGESAEIVENAKCGYVLKRGNDELERISSLIIKLVNEKEMLYNMGKNGSEFIKRNFLREEKTKLLDGIIKSCIEKKL